MPKVTLDRKQLLAAMSTAATVAPARSPKEVLQSTLLKATGDTVSLEATDLAISITVAISECECDEPFKLLLPTKRLMTALTLTSTDTVSLELTKQGCALYGDESHSNFNTEDPAEFPSSDFNGDDYSCTIDAEQFNEALREAGFACDTESLRFALGGVLVSWSGNKITFVSTDGRRLAQTERDCVTTADSEPNLIIPEHAVQALLKAKLEGEVQLQSTGSKVFVFSDRCKLATILQEGRFPNWQQVIPQYTSPCKVVLDSKQLERSLKYATNTSDEETRGVNIAVELDGLKLSSASKEIGAAECAIPAAITDHTDLTVRLDGDMLVDFLTRIKGGGELSIEAESPQSAVLFAHGKTNYVQMPMSLEA